MALHDEFARHIIDSSLIARLHRTNGLELIGQAEIDGNEPATLSADAAIRHADRAIVVFREALGLLPDLTAAFEVKRSGDIALLESGWALVAARRKLGPHNTVEVRPSNM